MTEIVTLSDNKSINKAKVSRRTGINSSRLSELSLKNSTRLTAEEHFIIALAIDSEPVEVLEEGCKHLKLENQ